MDNFTKAITDPEIKSAAIEFARLTNDPKFRNAPLHELNNTDNELDKAHDNLTDLLISKFDHLDTKDTLVLYEKINDHFGAAKLHKK